MKVKELVELLKIIPPELEVKVSCEEFHCSGHGEGEYCYCPIETKWKNINNVSLVNNDNEGRHLDMPVLQIATNI